ncbi:MAG: hypothetical protein K6A34_01770 [Methanobrevibacter sp.]|nr:hypothetical protein [Methanobrevibacter sp.]
MNPNFEFLLKKYYTARIDIKNYGKNNNILILDNNDENSGVSKPDWFNDCEGSGIMIESSEGILDLKLKCINDGLLKIFLKGPNCNDKNGNRFPIYIDYTDLSVNDKPCFNENQLVWHDKPYVFSKMVCDGEILDIHIQWMPFNPSSEFKVEESHELIQSLKAKVALREKQLQSIPQLSHSTLGFSALDGKLIYRNLLPTPNGIFDDFGGRCENFWFTRFIKDRFPDENFKINLFGFSNVHDNLAYPMDGKKVFFSIWEDLNCRFLEMKYNFDTYALDYVDLAMGMDIIDNPKYLRIPFWFISFFSPETTEEDIENKVESWNSTRYNKSRDVVAIASHDIWGTRTIIDNDINKLTNVTYAGRWKNNTSELLDAYNDHKLNYLKEFKFNLCPENLLVNAYVTEKIFHSIDSDCIPLYAGGGNYLEPELLNPKAIIRWDGEEKWGKNPNLEHDARLGLYTHYPVKWEATPEMNSDSVELFKNLLTDEKSYAEFKDQDKILPSGVKYIKKMFDDMEKHFERLIYS